MLFKYAKYSEYCDIARMHSVHTSAMTSVLLHTGLYHIFVCLLPLLLPLPYPPFVASTASMLIFSRSSAAACYGSCSPKGTGIHVCRMFCWWAVWRCRVDLIGHVTKQSQVVWTRQDFVARIREIVPFA